MIVFSYGGGRQTVAMVVMILKGVLPKPDVVVIADTGRENTSTWEYLNEYVDPALRRIGLEVEIASHSLATVDLYSGNGDLLVPAYTESGKMLAFCSSEWKQRVVDRYLKLTGRSGTYTKWLGLALDEKRRWVKLHGSKEGRRTIVCPLVDKMINTDVCLEIIRAHGWPEPVMSSCWMCPNKRNRQWRVLRDEYPEEFEAACKLDDSMRDNDGQGGVWLHHSRVPLRQADIDYDESRTIERQCSLGMCFV